MKNFRATLFFKESVSCSKILNNKKYIFNTVRNFRATPFFRASARCSKILNGKNIHSIQGIQGTLSFSGQAQVAQKS